MATLPAACIHCGLTVSYVRPGSPPADAQTGDINGFYDSTLMPSRNFALVDTTGALLCSGASAVYERGVTVGQWPVHEVHGINGVP